MFFVINVGISCKIVLGNNKLLYRLTSIKRALPVPIFILTMLI